MAWYYITYCLFVLFLSMNIGAYSQYRGASQKHYKLLEKVTAGGTFAFILFSVCHFFVTGWVIALVLIAGALLLAPIIGMSMGRNLLAITLAPYLVIITAIIFFCIQSRFLGWWSIYQM